MDFSRNAPSIITGILAAGGMFSNWMLHPIHPARLAVAANGFRFRIAETENA